jgi:hypothetical protein
MTNLEMAESYLAQAREIFQEVEGAYRRGVWNLAVRRAQEAVTEGLVDFDEFARQVQTYLGSVRILDNQT